MSASDATLILDQLLSAGLILGGDFARPNGERESFSMRLDLLGSYPELLAVVVDATAERLERDFSRLLCGIDTLPLAVGLSLRTGIPLVYSRNSQDAPVFDLVGAYDIGHTTLLVVNILEQPAELAALIQRAGSVGLNITAVQGIVDLGEPQSRIGFPTDALIARADILRALAIPRPGSTMP